MDAREQVDPDAAERARARALSTAFGVSATAVLVLLALTEEFASLPGAVVALASSWWILRR